MDGFTKQGAPATVLEEGSLDTIQRLIDLNHEHKGEWQFSEKIGDTALRQAELHKTDS